MFSRHELAIELTKAERCAARKTREFFQKHHDFCVPKGGWLAYVLSGEAEIVCGYHNGMTTNQCRCNYEVFKQYCDQIVLLGRLGVLGVLTLLFVVYFCRL